MPQRMPFSPTPPRHQRGVSLFIVLICVMLTMLLTLWASRTSLVNEMVVGNDADWQRAFEAAQTLLQDAEQDIRGKRPNNGRCIPHSSSSRICRQGNTLQIPLTDEGGKDGVMALFRTLEPLPQQAPCKDGLCLKIDRAQNPDFWNHTGDLKARKKEGARYGMYTGAKAGSTSAPGNPILAETGSDRGGWYWIEVMRLYKTSGCALIADCNEDPEKSNWIISPNAKPSVVYRITALAKGRKEHTNVVLQQMYAQNSLID